MKKAWKALRVVVVMAFRADFRRALATFIFQPLTWIASTFLAYLLKLLADGAARQDFSSSMVGAVGLAITFGIVYLFGGTTAKLNASLTERTGFYLDQKLMDLSSNLPKIEHHERPEFLDQMELLREGRGDLGRAVGTVVYGLSSLGQTIVIAVLLASLHPLMLLLPLFALPSFLAGMTSQKRMRALDEMNAGSLRLMRHLFSLTTTTAPAKEIRIFGLTDWLLGRHETLWEKVYRSRFATRIRMAFLSSGATLVFGLGFVGAIWFVVNRALNGLASVGDVLLAVLLAGQVNSNVSGVIGYVTSLYRQLSIAHRYLWLIDYGEEVKKRQADELRATVPDSMAEGIWMENLSFRYPGTEADVLKDVSLMFPVGSTVALVGENGAGKTTLVKLLLRFYDPTEGRILLDGTDIRSFDIEEWRRRSSAGFQDFCRFEFLARETVGVGDPPHIESVPAVSAALVRAGSTEAVTTLPNGLETQLGPTYGGVDVSVGQWQKLALGRSMMRDAPLVLVLDEPTSSLDAPTEHALFERFARITQEGALAGSLTILVSHRFSTVRMADLIVVIDGGLVLETGSHEELMQKRGLYAELFELQARAFQ